MWWQTQDKKTIKRINLLIRDMQRSPFEGIGKPPEPLKENLSGWWSRRIDEENRIVYRVADGDLIIASCRNHYDDK
jgi:toxin YoeB